MGKLHIVSNSDVPFADRIEAGRLLARELKGYEGKEAVVLGILRGGIIIAREIALGLDTVFDIVLSRKLGAPDNPELAIGAVSEDGNVFLNREVIIDTAVNDDYIAYEKQRKISEIKRRVAMFRAIYPKVSLEGKIAIVTDDGVATGATMQATLWALRQEKPSRLIAALPVGPWKTLSKLTHDADEVVCLRAPVFFSALSQFYLQFKQVEDEEVLKMLKIQRSKP
jgi:putative phosphoribosyl transferase